MTSNNMMIKVSPTSILIYKQRKPKKYEIDNHEITAEQLDIFNSLTIDNIVNTCATDNISHQPSDDDGSNNVSDILPKKMSSRTKRKIKDRIIAYSYYREKYNIKGQITFFTLTLTSEQITSDSETHSMLNTFLTRLRKEYKDIQYLWVAERQGNGNIHYHIVFNKAMYIGRLNYYWCKILENKGYDVNVPKPYHVQAGKRVYLDEPADNCFFDSKDKSNPVDVRKVYDEKGLAIYITKYITKNDTEIDGLTWHCSRFFSRLETSKTFYFTSEAIDWYKTILEQNFYICQKTNEKIVFNPIDIFLDDEKKIQIGTILPLVKHSLVSDILKQLN